MTMFETFAPRNSLEEYARRLLTHVEAAADREGREYPQEAQKLADCLREYDEERLAIPHRKAKLMAAVNCGNLSGDELKQAIREYASVPPERH